MKNKYFRPQLFGTLMIFMLVFTVLGIGQNQVVSVSAQGPGCHIGSKLELSKEIVNGI